VLVKAHFDTRTTETRMPSNTTSMSFNGSFLYADADSMRESLEAFGAEPIGQDKLKIEGTRVSIDLAMVVEDPMLWTTHFGQVTQLSATAKEGELLCVYKGPSASSPTGEKTQRVQVLPGGEMKDPDRAPPVTDLPFGAGSAMTYEMADFDRNDSYEFVVKGTGATLSFDWQLVGVSDGGTVSIPADARAAARTLLTSFEGDIAVGNTPIFLLSPAAFSELKAGETRLKVQYAAEETTLTLAGEDTLTIELDGVEQDVTVLKATNSDEAGGDLAIWVLDSVERPLILKVEEAGGDNFWTLKSLAKAA
jgi:hypothetical protein